jgi:tripartite ATP-independent transporter DctM subunit
MTVAIVFVFFLAIGMPIGVTIGLAAMVGIVTIGPEFMVMVPSKIFAALNSFVFLAMPFFILAGEIMNIAGITDRIAKFAKSLVGHWRGGLAQTNTLATILFAGISGSATADAAAFGRTLVPVMVKNGYTRGYSCAVTAAGSIVGPTIPPSSIMVLYGSQCSSQFSPP